MPAKMKAAVLHAPYNLVVEEAGLSEVNRGDVLVEVEATGICGTDLAIYNGRYKVRLPLILGHETAGNVVKVGNDVKKIQVGDRVLVNPVFSCGKCYLCMMGRENLCLKGGLLGRDKDGSFAEYLLVPEGLTFRIPETMPYEEGALTQLLTGVYHGQKRIRILPSDSVLVIGQGPSGLLHTRLAKLSGANPVIASTRSRWKLELARSYGADVTVNPAEENLVKKVLEFTEGRGVDVVVESVGSPETIKQSIEAVRPGGTVLIFGICTQPVDGLNAYSLYYKELKLVGTRGMKGEDFEPCIKLVSSGAVNLRPLITRKLRLERIVDGFELLDKHPADVLKVVVTS